MNVEALQLQDEIRSVEALREAMGDHAKDIRLNLGTVLTPEGAPDLTQNQITGIALACAYATRDKRVIRALEEDASAILSSAEKLAARAAATVMAMNNVYYRFTHLVEDPELKKLPAKLRMNVIGSPGIPKADFELYCMAVSAINGCGMCMEAHAHELTKAGVSKLGIQSAVRIGAVVSASAQAFAE